jgi:hypothetical protein
MFSKNFFKNWKFLVLACLLLCAVFGFALSALFLLNQKSDDIALVEPEPEITQLPPEDVSLFLEKLNEPPPLTTEEIEEESRIVAEQVAHAREWLESADPKQRLIGAEQLSAYPTVEAEKLLVETLLNDSEPEVRSAAACSLEYIENPDTNTLNDLLQALETDNEEVAVDALNTLTTYVAREPYASGRATEIINKLKLIAESPQLQGNAQTAIENYLADKSADEEK